MHGDTVFDTIMRRQNLSEQSLGNPLRDPLAIARRQNHFAMLTGGRGFRQPPKEPKVNSQGLTRGDRKRAAWARAFASDKRQAT